MYFRIQLYRLYLTNNLHIFVLLTFYLNGYKILSKWFFLELFYFTGTFYEIKGTFFFIVKTEVYG